MSWLLKIVFMDKHAVIKGLTNFNYCVKKNRLKGDNSTH